MHSTPRFAAIAASAMLSASTALHAQYATGREVQFVLRVESVSTPELLRLSNGKTAPAAVAPLVWTVTDQGNPLFMAARRDAGHGLRQLAEDGNPGVLADWIKANLRSVSHSGVVTTPVGDAAPGPITPGKAYELTFPAAPGQRLSLAAMFGQSNDLFYAPGARGIALFDAKGAPRSGDLTAELILWDAGTEVNEEPGNGAHQAPRQAAPGAGTRERRPVQRVSAVRDGFHYPATAQVLRVTLRPATMTAAP